MISFLTSSVRRIEPFFGPDAHWVETLRQDAWRAAQRLLGDAHTFVRDKGRSDYVTTANASPHRVAEAFYNHNYQRNLMSTVKTRKNSSVEFVHSAWVLDTPDTQWQQDVYLFENDNGSTDVYSHKEPSVRLPDKHLDLSTGVNGDPDGRVRAVLHDAGIKHNR